ncbi:DUF6191 domain-containing protein [Actinacidiphila glaucinigra]|uniref:DUF6191 domain-containing protein n=1 Tax=Actinacidiphila glaucinigra TaxID=235986 RepID=UPI002E372555|nr:DUF6191 domain-containing protein [Actinacidiphila glaucinigra]
MESVVFMPLPGLVILLIGVAFVDQVPRLGRWGGRSGQVSSTGFEQPHASFSPGRRSELDERRATLMLRDEGGDGAPPRSRVDLGRGTALIVVAGRDRSG